MFKTHKLLIIVCILFHFSLAKAQNSFGVKGGLNFTFFNVNNANFGENNETALGYYFGAFMTINLNQNLEIQPELLYIGLNDFKFLNAPIYLKYNITKKANILVGPSLNYFFDFFNAKFKVRADLALAYTIFNNLNANIKYTIGFQEITPNGLFLGLGYKL